MQARESSRAALLRDLKWRLSRVEDALAQWASWMGRRHRSPGQEHAAARPAQPLERLNALHAELAEEIERLERQTSTPSHS